MWHAEQHGAVLVLTYTRPLENVIGLAELDDALARWVDDDRTQVFMLTGGAARIPIAHADLADVSALTHRTATGPYVPQARDQALRRIAAIAQPVIAAVNGQAWGDGPKWSRCWRRRADSPATMGGLRGLDRG